MALLEASVPDFFQNPQWQMTPAGGRPTIASGIPWQGQLISLAARTADSATHTKVAQAHAAAAAAHDRHDYQEARSEQWMREGGEE